MIWKQTIFYRGKIELFEKHDWSWSNIFKDKKNLRVISLLSIFSSMNITVWTAETTIHLAFVTTKLCLYDRWQCISLEIKKIEELLRRNLALGTSYWSAHQDCNIVCTSRHWRRIHIAQCAIMVGWSNRAHWGDPLIK